MPRIIYSAAALRDIERLRAFIGPKNPAAARRAAEAIRNGVRLLGSQPHAGRRVENLPEPYREWVIDFGRDGYVIRYRADRDTVTILAIRHGREGGF